MIEEGEYLETETIQMLLQPLIENALRHCLEGFYKGESILTINSEIGRGTKVTIIIPVRMAKENA